MPWSSAGVLTRTTTHWQRQSDWAKLGLVLRDGKLVLIKDTLVSPSEQTLVAPDSRNMDKTVDKEGDGDESGLFSMPVEPE